MSVSATNSLGWEVQTRRIISTEAWRPAVTEVKGKTEVPLEPFKTREEAEELLEEMMDLGMDSTFEFRVYEVLDETKKK